MARKPLEEKTGEPSSGMFTERTLDIISDDEKSTDSSGPLIGKTLFNVHKYQLAKSEVFSDRFNKPKPEGNEPKEGSSLDYPIKLKGVSSSDFAALLRVLYASHFSSNQPTPEAPLIIPAFRLANIFKFEELRVFLLPLAETNLNDVDKNVFAREFNIKEWLVPAHVRLCQREKPLSGEEARKLGVESVLIILRLREKHRSKSQASSLTANHYYCYDCVGVTCVGDGFICQGCSIAGVSGYLHYIGPEKMVRSATTSTATLNSVIEAEVKKWVEDGCITKD